MRIILATFLFFSATSAHSAPALVKSGEHESFTRLVIYTGEFQKWTLSQSSNSATLKISDWDAGFDISKVFNFIPRERITDITPSNEYLQISLGCNCNVDVEPLAEGGLIVDISESTFQVTPTPRPVYEITPEEPTSDFTASANKAKSIRDFRKNLTEQIGKSTTQSILIPVPAHLTGTPHLLSSSPKESGPEQHVRASPASGPESGKSSIIDTQCPPATYTAIEDWGPEYTFASQISEIRQTVFGEFDNINRNNALKLVKSYIRFSMGTEAESILKELTAEDEETILLQAIAKAIDAPKFSAEGLIPVNGCSGVNAIWAITLDPESIDVSKSQSKVISQEFLDLPQHLKTSLGSRIINSLNKNGHEIASSVVKNSLDSRQPLQNTITPDELENLTKDELAALISKGKELVPDAIVALLNLNNKTNTEIDPTFKDVALSYAYQQEGTPFANTVLGLISKQTAIEGDHIDALNLALSNFDPSTSLDAVNFITQHIADHGEDVNVARFAVQIKKLSILEKIEKPLMEKISSRLKKSGMSGILTTQTPSTPQKKQLPLDDDPQKIREASITRAIDLKTASNIVGESKALRDEINKKISPESP